MLDDILDNEQCTGSRADAARVARRYGLTERQLEDLLRDLDTETGMFAAGEIAAATAKDLERRLGDVEGEASSALDEASFQLGRCEGEAAGLREAFKELVHATVLAYAGGERGQFVTEHAQRLIDAFNRSLDAYATTVAEEHEGANP